MMSMSAIETSGVDCRISIASLPVVAVRTRMPRRSKTLLRAKMLRGSSSTSRTVRPTRSSSELCILAHRVQHLEAAHVGQVQIEHYAVAALLLQYLQRGAAAGGAADIDVAITKELANAHAFGGVVLDNEEALAPRLAEVANARD